MITLVLVLRQPIENRSGSIINGTNSMFEKAVLDVTSLEGDIRYL